MGLTPKNEYYLNRWFSLEEVPEIERLNGFPYRLAGRISIYLHSLKREIDDALAQIPASEISPHITDFIHNVRKISAGMSVFITPDREVLFNDRAEPAESEDFSRWDEENGSNIGVAKYLRYLLEERCEGIENIKQVATAFALLNNKEGLTIPVDDDFKSINDPEKALRLQEKVDELSFYMLALRIGHPIMIEEIKDQAMQIMEQSWVRLVAPPADQRPPSLQP